MDIELAFSICKNLKHKNKQALYNYFDIITLSQSIEEFLSLTNNYLINLTNTESNKDFIHHIKTNLINKLTTKQTLTKKTNINNTALVTHTNNQNTDIFCNFYDFGDEYYQALYQNDWQDYGYLSQIHETDPNFIIQSYLDSIN